MDIKLIDSSVYFDLDTKLYLFPINNLKNCILNSSDFILNYPLDKIDDLNKLGINFELQELLLKKVSLYDSSSAVNSFIYNGQEYWLSKGQRNSLLNLFSNSDPEEELEVVFGNVVVKNKAKVFSEFLINLEKYAYKCFVTTLKHLNAITQHELPKNEKEYKEYIDFLTNYDYTTGYPDKLELK